MVQSLQNVDRNGKWEVNCSDILRIQNGKCFVPEGNENGVCKIC